MRHFLSAFRGLVLSVSVLVRLYFECLLRLARHSRTEGCVSYTLSCGIVIPWWSASSFVYYQLDSGSLVDQARG